MFVDRASALGSKGAHDDGEGEGRGPAEQQGVQPRSQRGAAMFTSLTFKSAK